MARRRMAARTTEPPGIEKGRPARISARTRFPAIAILAGVAATVSGPAHTQGELYRCEARDAFTVERGQLQRGSAATALRAAIDPLLVDTDTGAVRFGGTQLHQWSIEQRGGASSDFVAEGGNASDGLWIRVWETPASFVLVQNSTNVVTGTCSVAN